MFISRGLSLKEQLLFVILRFVPNKIIFIADIEKAFLQISLKPEHRDFVQLLFHENRNENSSQSKICDYRICRVLFGVTPTPFLLTSTINKQFVDRFLNSLDVDSLHLNSGSENINDCYNFYNKAKARFDQALFNLWKFQSNSSNLEYLINGEINHNSIVTKIWEKQKNITFSFKSLLTLIDPCVTLSDNFEVLLRLQNNPFCLINPFVFRLKALFQIVCTEKLGWNDILSE